MKIKSFILTAAITLALLTPALAEGFYQTDTLYKGYISNATTVTASSPISTINTTKQSLALSPVGGVCPVDVQIYCVATNASTALVIATFKTSVDGVKWTTASLTATNTLNGTTEVVNRHTMTNLVGNPKFFKLVSVSSAHTSWIDVKVDYGYWRTK